MGQVQPVRPAMLLVAAFSRHSAALQWTLQRLQQETGVALSSEPFAFDHTGYYQPEMGAGLLKQLHLLEGLVDPAALCSWKLRTNQWEQEAAQSGEYPEPRPLNLDPGYVTEAKLVLATTKDRDHRIYLGQGIYAEVTLFFRGGAWRTREWTYADYAEPRCHQFLDQCRKLLRQRR